MTDDIIERLKADIRASKPGRFAEIAVGSGVNIKTLRNIFYGATKDLSYRTAQKLIEYYAVADRPTPSADDQRPAA